MRIFVSERDFLQWLRMLEAMAESRSHTLFRRDRQIARRKAAAHQQALATIHHRSRPSTGQHWSPVSGHAEEPFAYTTPPLQPALFSPQGMPTPTSLQQVPSPSIASPFSRAPAPDFGWAASQPHLLALPPSHPASRSNSPDMRPSYGRPSSSSSNSSFSSIKRAFGALQTASPRGSDDSPHRPSKRFAAAPYQDDFAYNARASLSPLEDLHHRRSRRPSRDLFEDATSAAPRPVPVNDVQWYQAQPAHQQHVAPLQGYHSVFDSAAVAPNTLLAPFAGYQDTNVQSRQNLLSYYSLASGKDRGILGVHLPPPIPSAHPAYAPISESRRPSATLPTDMRSVASHGMVPAATTTPYPTPAFEFDRVQSYPVNPYPPSVWAGGLSSASPVPAGPDFGTHHVEPLGQTHASTHRAPFNNAQGCYMPHWAPPHSSHMQ